MNDLKKNLQNLFSQWGKEKLLEIYPLVQSGSNRKYFRIKGNEKSAIGVFNPDKRENLAFLTFTKHFHKKGLNVPKLYAHKLKESIYLLEDLGDTTLYSLIDKEKTNRNYSDTIINYYKEALKQLISFQIEGGKGLDYSVCYPRSKFDKQSILWDLNYFKYYFLKLANIPFDEQNLEDDFNNFTKLLLSADTNYFMYRDFQSRNIIVNNNQLYFIDYQGGRKGALQYDVASLLFQAKVNLSPQVRSKLLDFYLDQLGQKSKVKRQTFIKHYYNYVLIRLLQTLGAYGFRGYYENKSHFLLSIPFALKNLQWLIDSNKLTKKLPELNKVLFSILKNEELKKLHLKSAKEKLNVTINSFSYKEGVPQDYSGNGGGFVFDCRSLDNPGRYTEYKNNTGLDKNVIRFLQNRVDVKKFLDHIFIIVDEAIENYQKRNFSNLMINFGCTGGQHRSVYCAKNLADHIKEKFDVQVLVNHIQLDKKGNL